MLLAFDIPNFDVTQWAAIVGIVMLLFGSKLRPILDPIMFALGYVPKDSVPVVPVPGPGPNPITPLLPANIQAIIAALQLLLNRNDAKGNEAAITTLETYSKEVPEVLEKQVK